MRFAADGFELDERLVLDAERLVLDAERLVPDLARVLRDFARLVPDLAEDERERELAVDRLLLAADLLPDARLPDARLPDPLLDDLLLDDLRLDPAGFFFAPDPPLLRRSAMSRSPS